MVVCQDRAGSRRALEDLARAVDGHHEGADRRVAFMFTGQGAQYVSVWGVSLYKTEPRSGSSWTNAVARSKRTSASTFGRSCFSGRVERRSGGEAAQSDAHHPAGAVCVRICARQTLDELGNPPARDDRSQHRRVCRRVSGQRVLAGGCDCARGRTWPLDGAAARRRHALRAAARSRESRRS